MSAADMAFLPIAELAGLIARKEVSPREACDSCLSRIAAVEKTLNCYITLLEDEALQAAKAAEQEIAQGRYRGPLHGVPVGIKDNICTAGVRTTCGSRLLKEWVPAYDATVVERLKAAGAIILGKTNMHEWAMGGSTINPHFGATRNPWNLDWTPGGSSGGSGAAVAAGLCAAALGTDGAGSVRYPAMACGVVGLKPTYGRVSRYGQMAPTSSLDHIGPLTRTVEDATLALQVLAGHDPRDPASARMPVPDYRQGLRDAVKGLRLGVPKEPFTPLSREVEEAVRGAVAVLEKLGMAVREVSLPHAKIDYTYAMWSPIANGDGSATRIYDVLRRFEGSLEDLGPDIRMNYLSATLMPASFYVDAQKARRILIREFDEALGQVDVLVTPMKACPGQTMAEAEKGVINVDGRLVDYMGNGMAYGIVYNLTGLPALTLPCGFAQAGVPIGLQIAGRPFEEATVLRVAHAYEQATPWHQRRPPV